MDIRIGVQHAPREISLEMPDDEKSHAKTRAAVEAALEGKSAVLWLTDKRGKETAIQSEKIAFVEFGAPNGDRKMGFGS
ncbi:ATP-binding protein [Actinomycetes bacterium]|nr:ATP-binding protein [Actinomycetes bacterium]